MPTTIEKTVYTFAELSDTAKEKARDWFREGHLDYEWWESVYEDAATVADCLGIDLPTRVAKLMGGGTRMEPCIYFRGFCSQGDGACFEGTYRFRKGWRKALAAYAPKDDTIREIGEALQAVQRLVKWTGTATTRHSGYHSHSGCMTVSCDVDYGASNASEDFERVVTQCMRDFADWIYKRLEVEHDYQLSEEVVDESITANEYQFNEDGTIE